MKTYIKFALMAFMLSMLSTTCDYREYYDVSIINKSSETVFYIRLVGENDFSAGYAPLRIKPNETYKDLVIFDDSEDRDKVYRFLFIREDDLDSDIDITKDIRVSKQCYTLSDFKKANWTVVYEDEHDN